MKKTTLIFLSTLIAVFLSASESCAGVYSTSDECRPRCSGGTCGRGDNYWVCFYGDNSTSGNVFTSPAYATLRGCQRVVQQSLSEEYTIIRNCYSYGSYYRYQRSKDRGPTCPTNCSSCSSSSVCTTCNSGYYLSSGSCKSCPANATCDGSSSFTCKSGYWLQSGACKSCPANATCDGSSSFTCKSGYKKSGNSCIKDRTVNSCPSRMKLSSDGCCCVNK